MELVDIQEIFKYRYEGIIEKRVYGEATYFYNPDKLLKNGVYVCTIKEEDGPNDKASKLKRDGVFRLSTGLQKKAYRENFKDVPSRPKKGEVVDVDVQFDSLNKIMPHPVYAWMGWICVNTPDRICFEEFLSYIDLSF